MLKHLKKMLANNKSGKTSSSTYFTSHILVIIFFRSEIVEYLSCLDNLLWFIIRCEIIMQSK